MTSGYIDVALPVAVRKTFTYSVPEHLTGKITEGVRVLVPFGRRLLTGFVVSLRREPPSGGFKVHAIRQALDSEPCISPDLIQTALWTADYYFSPPGEILRSIAPAGSAVSGSRMISLNQKTERLLRGGLRPSGLGPRENMIIDALLAVGPLSAEELSRQLGFKEVTKWIDSLDAAGLVETALHVRRPRVAAKQQLGICALANDAVPLTTLTEPQRRLYARLDSDVGPISLQTVLRESRSSMSAARALERKGLVAIAPMPVERAPLELERAGLEEAHRLTAQQDAVWTALRTMLLRGRPERCLLHGVTGSGKTEIYLRLIADALASGGSSLFLVPEIGLTPLLSRIVVSRFPDQVSILHSGMSAGERYDQWHRIKAGGARVVVGTRSAVFAPLVDLKLIIIDEEQDASYKQDETPCYHAREVAWQRVLYSNGLLLMGSATPSLESYHSARVEGKTAYFCLSERIEARPLPEVTIVDMGGEFQRQGRKTILSETLREELAEQLKRGEQSIILLNRRGYARTLLCRSCGNILTCRECSISMTYHQKQARMICHYCGLEEAIPTQCGNCGGEYIYFVGVGTEQLEEIVRSLVPQARIARVDRDTTRRRGSLRKMLLEFADRKLDILVGTQMLAKGHDFPNVTLVGVVAGDAGLTFPDFRAAERTFQLLIQVAGRSGRGTVPGRVVIQAFYPQHYALRLAQKQDFEAFFNQEIELRRLMGYPPFRDLVQVVVSEGDHAKAVRIAERVAGALRFHNQRRDASARLHILGPAPAPIEKLRGQYRLQILIKATPGGDTTKLLRETFEFLARHKLSLKKVHIDVDPLSLL